MRTAQQLYEGITLGTQETVGLITYMRTDSTNIAESAGSGISERSEKFSGIVST